MINVEEKKAKITEVLKSRGPMLPIQVAKEIELSSLFTSAIMSEMISDRLLKVSNLKVGGSPLYYIDGQEELLENFSNYLGQKEKEVYLLLRERKILQDELLEPAHRVAIRGVKDFAIPLKVNVNNEEKIFWRFFSFPMEDVIKRIRELTTTKAKAITSDKKLEKIHTGKKETGEKTERIDNEFPKLVYDYLTKNDIKISQEIEKRKKEIVCSINLNSSLGKIEMLLIAKDKKTITEDDLNLALNKGNNMKLPVLFLSNGKPNKKAISEIENFKSYLIFRQVVS